MLLFWTLASLMILAALLLVLPALMRGDASSRDPSADANVALYRERLAELDRERDRGDVDAERHAALREDLERGLLRDVGDRAPPRAFGHPPPYWMPVAVAVLVPVCGLGLYLWLGSPHGLEPRPAARAAPAGTEPTPSVETMVALLAARLADNPADAEGWLLLARSQVALERFDAALAAFERAHALLGDDPSLLADWAEAEAGIAGNRFPASALGRLERALELDPGHEKALCSEDSRRCRTGARTSPSRAGSGCGRARSPGRGRNPSSPRCSRGSRARRRRARRTAGGSGFRRCGGAGGR